jgi:hypothetical protein
MRRPAKDGPEARDVPVGVWAHQGCPGGAIPTQSLLCGPLEVYGPRLQSLVPFGEGLYWVWPCSPCDWALICLVSGPSPLGLMSDVYIVVFLIYFRHIFYVILSCPPTNDESPKLVEFVSYKP